MLIQQVKGKQGKNEALTDQVSISIWTIWNSHYEWLVADGNVKSATGHVPLTHCTMTAVMLA